MPDYMPDATRCTALTSGGKFCDYESLPDAPFPVCVKHAAQVLRYLNSYAPADMGDQILLAVRAMIYDREQHSERRRYRPDPLGQVYYLQVGKLIKIGYSDKLHQRMRQYPPDSRLLAVEPGTRATEARRHEQFAQHLQHGREWFSPSPSLLAHIRAIRDRAA